MKSLVQYLVAILLVILGIVLLCNPSRPAETTSELQVTPDSNSQVIDRPAVGPTMGLA
jgi:hypothetical protein